MEKTVQERLQFQINDPQPRSMNHATFKEEEKEIRRRTSVTRCAVKVFDSNAKGEFIWTSNDGKQMTRHWTNLNLPSVHGRSSIRLLRNHARSPAPRVPGER